MNWLAGQQLLRRDESVVGCDFNIWSWQCIGCCWLFYSILRISDHSHIRPDFETKVSADTALEGKKIIAFYFSAHWCLPSSSLFHSFSDLTIGRQFFYFFSFIRCPPCRLFTPVLAEFYSVSFYSPYPRIHLFFLLHFWNFSSKNTKIHNKLMIPKI